MELDISLLERLSNAIAPSGYEGEVVGIIREELADMVDEIHIDEFGNVLAFLKGSDPRILLDAHTDEVSFLITHIEGNGVLRFYTLGSIDPRVAYGQRVVLKGEKGLVRGFIGAKAPHLLKKEELQKVPDYSELFIDIGAESKEEALSMGIKPGTVGTFDSKFVRLTENRIMGKAFDDRVGVFVIISVLKMLKDSDVNVVAAFSTQEEVGLRGARLTAWKSDAKYGLALECTAASDVPGTPEHLYSTSLGKGPAITIADRSVIAHPKIVRLLIETAEENDIPYQFKSVVAGGTDAGVISLTKGGIPSGVVSVPARYIHGPAAIADLRDIENTISLVYHFVKKISKEKI